MVVRVCVLCGTPGISQPRRVGAHPGMRGGFEISLQRYNIFRQVVGNVLPIITGGCNFSSDWSGRTRAGAVGFEISLQRYYIFLPFVGQVRPIITLRGVF